MGSRAPLSVVFALIAACSLDPVDLRGKECPCAPGWLCEDGICVGEADEDGGSVLDAGGAVDGGRPMDATARDTGVRDAGSIDAAIDGGPTETDAGTDSGMDAGMDSGTIDGGPSPSACTSLSAVFCDGFEDPGFTAWNDDYGTGTRTRVTSPPLYRGTGSLRATGPPDGLSAWARTGLPDLGPDVYVRGYVYIADSFDLVDVGLMYVGDSDFTAGFGVGVETGGRAYIFLDSASDGVVSTVLTVPRNTWTCLRAHVRVSDTAGIAEVFIDGARAAMETGLDTRLPTPYSRFAAGLTYISPAGGAPTVYLDDVAVGTSPLPCD